MIQCFVRRIESWTDVSGLRMHSGCGLSHILPQDTWGLKRVDDRRVLAESFMF
ncbi:hypothetical protein SAMN05428977_102933 [Nitrosomonas sp. Nm166]|nr:hypothetical protein SAMN05428977_102933 [Nitrosomonas sp. Nm166]